MDSLEIRDISRFYPLIERFTKIKDEYGDNHPIVLYEPKINCQEKKTLKDLLQGNNSIHLFSDFKEAFKFVQSLGISFILMISASFDEKIVIKNFRGSEKIYGRPMFGFEEEELLKDVFGEKFNSLKLKAYVFTSILDLMMKIPLDDNEEEVMVMCGLKEMAKEFRQDFTVIWYEPKMNSERKSKLEDEIGMKIEEENIFLEKEELYQKMKSYTGTPYHLIFSGRNEAKKILGEIDSFKDLLGLYIYDENNPQKFLNEKVEIERTLEELIPKIKEGFRTKSKLVNTFPSFATHFDAVDKSHSYFLHYYLKGLINFKNRKQAKRDFVKLGQKIYQDRLLEKFDTEYDEYNGEKILHWYTKDSPVYKLLNNCLRMASSDSILYSRFVLKDMEEAIRERYEEHSKDFNGLVYRGAYISTEEWKKLERNIGEEIEMYGFLSTTVNQRTAVQFFKGDKKNKIFITIIVPPLPELDEQGFADVSQFSEFKGEGEILFNVRSRFKILEAKVSRIDNRGTKGRHLVLLYGARSLRKYMTEYQPTLHVELTLPSEKRCGQCGSASKLFAFNQVVTKVRCLDCLIKNSVPKDTPLFNLDLENKIGERVISFKGEMLKFRQEFDFSNSGYKCHNCQKIRKIQYYKWVDLKSEKQFIQCSDCFKKKKETGCHIFLAESAPYTLWQEYQAVWEKVEADHQAEVSITVMFEDQGRIFELVQRFDLCLEYERRMVNRFKRRRWREKEKLENFFNIGKASEECGKYQQALIFLQEVMNMTKILFGEEHFKTADCLRHLSSVYHIRGEFKKALEYDQQSLEITKRIYGDKHLQTAVTYCSLSIQFQDLGRYKEALMYSLRALDIFKALYGENHPKTAGCYNTIGNVVKFLGQKQNAIEYHKKALEIRRNIYGDKHPGTAESYNNVAQMCEVFGEYRKALEYHQQALKIVLAIYGENHRTVAISLNNHALAYGNLMEYRQAFEYHKKTINVKKTLFGEMHPDVAISYSNLGSLYMLVDENDNAIEYLEKSLKIMVVVYGVDHPETATLYNAFGLTCSKMEKNEKALEYHNKALEIRETIYGDQHPDTAVSYNNLGDVFSP